MAVKQLMRVLCCAFVLNVFLSVIVIPARGETITLNSGRVLTGEIVDKGRDYVKIKTDSGLFKVKHKQIKQSSIGIGSSSGAAGAANVNVEAELQKLAEELSDQEWQARLDDYETYLTAVNRLQDQYMRSMSESTRRINEAIGAHNFPAAHKAAKAVLSQMQGVQRKLEGLSRYPELEPYHEKVAEAIRMTIKSIQSWQMSDRQLYHKYRRDSIRAMIASMEEYAVFSRVMWTGTRKKSRLDDSIQRMKSTLEQQYY